MQPGCPHSQRGADPAFPHRSNTGALTSPQDDYVTPKPVTHPANGKQNITVAIPNSSELRVNSPAQWQRSDGPSPQNFPELHQQESQASIENHRAPRASTSTSQNSHCHISRRVNDDFHSLAHVSAQHCSYFGTSANENSVKQSFYNSGQQKECSNRNFSRTSLKGSNLNKNNGLRNGAFLASASSAVLQGERPGNTAMTFPSQQCSSVPESKRRSPSSLLKGNPVDSKYFFTTPDSSSKKSNSNIELNTSTHLSDEGYCKSRHTRSSLPALNCGPTTTQNPKKSRGTRTTLHQQQLCSPSLTGQTSTDKVLPVGETEPPTDDQIHNFIAERLLYFRTYGHTLSNNGGHFCSYDQDSTLIMPKSHGVTLPSTVSDSDKDVVKQSPNSVVVELCTAAVGQELEEDSKKGRKAKAELTPKSTGIDDCTTSASENHSTGTLLSAIENSKYDPKSESVEKSASVACDLPVKKHLDVTMTAYGDGKPVYSDECCEDKTLVRSNDESLHSKWWCDKSLQNVKVTLHYTLTALRDLIASLENVETIAEVDNFSEVILQQYWNGDIDNINLFASTEYPQIMVNVAATCTKNEDDSPVVHHLTVKKRGFTGLTPVETGWFGSVQGVTDVSEDLPPKSGSAVSENKTSPAENHDANTKKKKNIQDQQYCRVICEEAISLSKPNSLIDKIQIDNVVSIPTYKSEQICEGVREKAGSVYSRLDLSIGLSENELKEQAPLSESEGEEVLSLNILKDPQYEDISDDDVSQLSTELPKTEHEELSFPTCFEDLKYEEISEDENSQIENPLLAHVLEPDNKQPLFENEDHKLGRAQMRTETKKQVSPKTEILNAAQYCCHLYFVEAGDGFEGQVCPKCDGEKHLARQTNLSVSCSPSNVLKYVDQTEDQMDDDWIVIPISMSDLTFGPGDEDQDDPKEVVLDDGEKERQGLTHCVLQCTAPKPSPASASSQLEVFDTIESFRQAKAVQVGNCFEVETGRSTPEHEMDSDKESHTPQERRGSEPEHSCETEDSCDYSSASEHNYLTVPRQLLKRSTHLPPKRYYSVSEKESDSDEVTNVQNSQTRSSDKLGCMQKLRQPIKTKAGSKAVLPKTDRQRISKKKDIIIIDSDTEDECDQNYNKKAKRKRLFSGAVDSEDALHTQIYSPKTEDSQCRTVKERFKKQTPLSTHSPAPHQYNVNESQFKGVMEDACPEQSHSTARSGQLIQASADSEHVQSVIILNSDTEDESRHVYKKVTRTRLYLPGSAHSVDAPCVHQKRGTANEKLEEPRRSTADLLVPQHQTAVQDTLVRNVAEDAHSMKKSGQLIEPKPGLEHIQHKNIRKTTSGKERTVFYGSEKVVKSDHICKKKAKKDSGNDFVTQNGLSTETVDRLSCDDSPEKKPLSVDKDLDSSLVPNHGILCLVQKSSQPNKCLQLVKESTVHKKDKDETEAPKTSIATNKKSDSFDMNTPHLCRNKLRFASKSKPANERHHETKNECQANVTQPKLVSRQLSLPSTSTSSLSSISGQLSEARGSSASSRSLSRSGAISASSAPPKSKQSPPIRSSFKLKGSHSDSSPSMSHHPHTVKGPSANTQSSPRKKVFYDWQNNFFPTRRDRISNPGMEKDVRTTNNDSRREAAPGSSLYEAAHRQRNRPHKPTALMKKSMCEAKEYKNRRLLEAPKEPSVFF